MGAVSSQANNAVAVAVGEKYAAQSGGMQGTVRDIAYSLSSAALGTVLALVFSVAFTSSLDTQATLDCTQIETLENSGATFGSNASFDSLLESTEISLDADDTAAAHAAFEQARLKSNQTLLVVLALCSAGMLLLSRNIPSDVKKPTMSKTTKEPGTDAP